MVGKLEELLQTLESQNNKGRSSSKSHLKQALYDWRIEGNWDSSKAEVIEIDECAYAFVTFTSRAPQHCVIRHLFVLEAKRGCGYGGKLIQKIKEAARCRNIERLRFFADKPSIEFYEKLGFSWHGLSKSGLPFYYGDLEGNKIDLPPSQQRFVKGTPI